MASSVKPLCTICHDDGISNSAVIWCTDCEFFFCGDCDKTHSKSHLSKHHKTMSAEDYQKLPTFMQEISIQCRDHKKKYELDCSFHACPCCVQCVTDKHTKCQDMKPLSDILQQVKSSVQLFEKDLKDVKENLETAIKYMKTRISTINTQKTKAVKKIQYMRKSINDYLNKLEQDILNDLESKHSKLKLNMTSLVQKMEQQTSKIDQIQSQFTKMTQYASELQMYIGLREIEKTTAQEAQYIEDLESGGHFIEKNLKVKISTALQTILQDVKSFGDIDINTNTSTLKIKAGRKDQAQHLVPNVPGIEQIKPSLLTKLTIPKYMTSLSLSVCIILPDGKFIIIRINDDKYHLLLFSNDGIFIRQIVSFTYTPYDACFVRNNTVAVTFGSTTKTALVDIERNTVIQTIKLSHDCYGVASDGQILVIIDSDSKCTTVNLNDMSHTILEGMGAVFHISIFQGNIYGNNYKESKICCYKSTGESLWTFEHQDIATPRGLTLDKNGFVYIASCGNNSIVVVSPDGKTCKTILSEADGIKRPMAIDINRETGMMIASTYSDDYNNTAFIYKI